MQPWAGQIEGPLWADIPDAAEGVAIDPDKTLHECAGIEECVASLVDLQSAAIEAGAYTFRVLEV